MNHNSFSEKHVIMLSDVICSFPMTRELFPTLAGSPPYLVSCGDEGLDIFSGIFVVASLVWPVSSVLNGICHDTFNPSKRE